ncbi:MAG: hypothetical protein ACPGSL_03095 [Vicingaceae bacterium]
MKNLTNKIIAFFLLLCFAVTIVPLNTFHKHTHTHAEETHCDINDKVHSDDGCHFSLYHNQIEEKHCDHNAHILTYEIECEFCKVLNSQRDKSISIKEDVKYANHNLSILLTLQLSNYNQSHSDLNYNKGPPSIV